MAHTTPTRIENYKIELAITEPGVSAFTVGRALAKAMEAMPDDTMDSAFDKGETYVLPLGYQILGEKFTEIGTARISLVSVATAVSL